MSSSRQDWLWNQVALSITASTDEGTGKKGIGYIPLPKSELAKKDGSPRRVFLEGSL